MADTLEPQEDLLASGSPQLKASPPSMVGGSPDGEATSIEDID